jgi:hypothetical protein
VLTPRSIVAVLAAGYVPELHPSARAALARQETRPITIAPTRVVPDVQKPKPKVPSPPQVKVPPVTSASVPTGPLHKLGKTPAGKALYTYFAAILQVTGMDQGKVYPLKKFLGNLVTRPPGVYTRYPGGTS